MPFSVPERGPLELDGDIVYSYLVGEIGAQRGDFATAYGHYLHAAILARDAYAAERATRIALFRKDLPGALRATRRWVELAPNAANARQTALLLFLRKGAHAEAMQQAEALLQIAEANEADGFVQIASLLTKEPDTTRAMSVVRELTERYAEDARAYFAQAIIENTAKDYAAAEDSLRRSLELRPDWGKPWVLLSQVLTAQGRVEEARDNLRRAVAKYPDDSMVRNAYARSLVDAAEYQLALEQFQILRANEPDDEDVLFAVGMLSIQLENWAEARGAWQDLRNLGKRYDEATYYLAQVEELSNNNATAIGLYAAVKEGDLRTDAALRLATLKAKSGQLREAREVLQQARVLDPERAVDAYLAEARLLHKYEDQQAVVRVYETALAAHPDNDDLLYNRALFAADIGRVDWAERDLTEILKRQPDNADALNALGYTLADLTERYDEAYGYILKAYKLKPDNPAIVDSLGWVYYRLGKLDQALKYLSLALEKSQDPEIAAHLGEVLWISGDRVAARRVWDRALEIDPEDAKLRSVVERFE